MHTNKHEWEMGLAQFASKFFVFIRRWKFS
jgi:hypothetical protein